MGEIDIKSLSLDFWQAIWSMFYFFFNKYLCSTFSGSDILLSVGCIVMNKTCVIVPSWSLYLGARTEIKQIYMHKCIIKIAICVRKKYNRILCGNIMG